MRRQLHNGRTLELELPQTMRGKYAEFPMRASIVRVTVDRTLAMRDDRLVPMDFASNFFADLIKFAQSPSFEGEYAWLNGPETGSLALYKIRWQNDQGVPRWENLLSVFLPESGNDGISNAGFFGSLLVAPSQQLRRSNVGSEACRKVRLDDLMGVAEAELANRCSPLRHPNDIVLLAAADLVAGKTP